MSQEDYDNAPQTLTIREFKCDGKIMVTTMLCAKKSSKKELFDLYKQRWHIEVDFRNIKTTMGMEHLRCKTPEMAIKELWVYLLAYNSIRILMAKSAELSGQLPRELSFKHTIQIWLAWELYRQYDDQMIEALLFMIAEVQVGNRPGRIEPRALKRRLKAYPLLMKARADAKEYVRKNGHPKKQK